MSLVLRPPGFFGVTLLLFRREAYARLLSPWFYGVASTVCVIAWAYGASFVQTFDTESVLVTTNPLRALNGLVVIVLGLVLGLRLASSIAWEREHGTLELVAVGPVLFEAIILANFLVELCVLAILMAVYLLYLLLAQPLGDGVVDAVSMLSASRLPLHALPTMALGLLVSASARTVRGAVLVYLVTVACLGVFQIGLGLLLALPPREISLAAAYLRAGLQGAGVFIDPISPVARLADLTAGLTVHTPLQFSHTLQALALTAITLAAAAVLLRARGAVA